MSDLQYGLVDTFRSFLFGFIAPNWSKCARISNGILKPAFNTQHLFCCFEHMEWFRVKQHSIFDSGGWKFLELIETILHEKWGTFVSHFKLCLLRNWEFRYHILDWDITKMRRNLRGKETFTLSLCKQRYRK